MAVSSTAFTFQHHFIAAGFPHTYWPVTCHYLYVEVISKRFGLSHRWLQALAASWSCLSSGIDVCLTVAGAGRGPAGRAAGRTGPLRPAVLCRTGGARGRCLHADRTPEHNSESSWCKRDGMTDGSKFVRHGFTAIGLLPVSSTDHFNYGSYCLQSTFMCISCGE